MGAGKGGYQRLGLAMIGVGMGGGVEEIVNKRHKLSIIGMVRWPSG